MVDEMTEPMTARERVIARYGWPLPAMAGAEEPAPDPAPDPTPDPSPEPAPPANPPADPEPDPEPFDKERALDTIRKQREAEAAARKELKELQAKVKEFEDASKSEEERRTERLSSAEREAASAKAEAARLRVALKKGLTEIQAKRLVGETEEELEADADELLESFGSKKDEGDSKSRRPKENLKPGTVPGAEPEVSDPAELAKQVPASW